MTATAQPSASQTTSDPAEVVKAFLVALERGDLDAAWPLLAEDAVWINVSLPAVRGRRAIQRLSEWGFKMGGGFRVHFHNVATEGSTVLTERTDALLYANGRLEQRFWVYGRFEVRDGQITVWRDSFDWGDIAVGMLRAIAGAFSPGLNRPWPGDA